MSLIKADYPQYADYHQQIRLEGKCTGCRQRLAECKCGRAALNLCTGCGRKLWNQEGKMVPFLVELKEFCSKCIPVDAA